ncbi:MAG: DNA primase [Candidatus Omnitrophica bacterium]|nr:DNA primase [Candidatus Omnitrophota bacterium]
MRYGEEIIERVQSLNDIVEIVSSYMPLRRAGKTFKAACPFHQEKTPSFIVNPERQIFHCFGCGAGGDVFSFLMKYENITFPEALKQLAERARVPLPEPNREERQESLAGKLFEINEAAFQYYRKNYEAEGGKAARAYLEKRGFKPQDLADFGIGYALPDWRGLADHLSKKGFGEELLLRSGLVVKSAQGSCYDLLRARVIFPIRNAQGKVVAFGGRIMTQEVPKYINSPETEIFRKRREFYGLNLAKRHIPEEPRMFIVEGYLDQIRLYAAGFRNTVATLGTALTEDHVRILKRYIQEAVLVYDGDKAGESASLRGMEIFLKEGLAVKLLALPAGLDPDDLVRNAGAAEFEKLARGAQDLFDFKLASLMKKFDRKDSLGLLKITGEFLDTFAVIPNAVLLDRYVNRLAAVLGVQTDSIRNELAKLKARKGEGRDAAAAAAPERKEGAAGGPVAEEEFMLLGLLLVEPERLEKVLQEVGADDFHSEESRRVFLTLKALFDEGEKITFNSFFGRLRDESLKPQLSKVTFFEMDELSRDKAVADCLRRIKLKKLEKERTDLERRIAQAESEGREEDLLKCMKQLQTLLASR